MKKTFIFALFATILLLTTQAFAASIFTTTIKDCSTEQVQDVLIEIMTGKNFVVNEVTPYKITFDKNFGDGFWVTAQNTTVRFNLLARDGNVKIMVTETEKRSDGLSQYERKRSIDHMIPIIRELKNAIDHTPIDEITNEAVDQLPGSGNSREKKFGLTLNEKDIDGYYRVKTIEPGSAAADAKIVVNDIILEINGQPLNTLDLSAINSYVANKWASGASLIMLVDHDGEKKVITIKKQ